MIKALFHPRYQTDVVSMVQTGYTGTQPGVREDILNTVMQGGRTIEIDTLE
jgi:hypothetical protein